jgi:hypothetical protein
MGKKQQRRRTAAMAAAQVFAAGDYDTSAALWSLAVFFDLYIKHGAEGTRMDFGPADTTAEIVKLVPRP